MRTLPHHEALYQGNNFDLERFLAAQDSVYAEVLDELCSGQKTTEWMWFIFPQIKGLDNSPLALHFGIVSFGEAVAYLLHPILGKRLDECTHLVNRIEDVTAYQIFDAPNDRCFHSSMTLFDRIGMEPNPFKEALQKFFDGKPDPLTLAMLR